ncbi:dihydroorotase [Lentibacillus saliphilus]|uniref:dihydroorotase n=1 Tax=Lentibacillus saliphilus TaxID=2737028 RepID=UPI001C306F81|nr:dihydroorotase [Lentibacillus saliphilus]
MTIRLKNASILSADNDLVQSDLWIKDGEIIDISTQKTASVDQTIDCHGKLLLPGLIDVHVHLREPGGEHKETIETGTRAAARGGFTTICAMPNTQPVPDHVEHVKNLQASIDQNAIVRVFPYCAITKDLKGEQLTDMTALKEQGAFAFTDDGVGIQTSDMMLQAMKNAAALDMPIVAHCEDNSIVYGGVVHDGEVAQRLQLPGLPALSEAVQIARDVLLAEKTGCHYHVCHVSSKESVRVIRDAKKAGIHVTAEVTPHHLLLNETDIQTDDPNFKMNPPLRSQADQAALLEGLRDGTIDFIATDHAPHAANEKERGFIKAPFGIVGLETAFPLLYTHLVKRNLLTLRELVDAMTIKPAHVFQLPYGKIEKNSVADLVLIDLDDTYDIDRDEFASLAKNTPFQKWAVFGRTLWTMVGGEIVYEGIHHGTTTK